LRGVQQQCCLSDRSGVRDSDEAFQCAKRRHPQIVCRPLEVSTLRGATRRRSKNTVKHEHIRHRSQRHRTRAPRHAEGRFGTPAPPPTTPSPLTSTYPLNTSLVGSSIGRNAMPKADGDSPPWKRHADPEGQTTAEG
jgi:hypothetical protein